MADIRIEVAYATPENQQIISLEISPNTTVIEAIRQSGILDLFQEIDLNKQAVGIFGKKVDPDAGLQDHDRVEIYRPLLVEPMEARKRRAKRSKSQRP